MPKNIGNLNVARKPWR